MVVFPDFKFLFRGALLLAAAGFSAAKADVVSVSASTEASLREFVNGVQTRSDGETLAHPDADLPLQATARLVMDASETQGAAAMGVQVADPILTQTNPEDFAINFSLASRAADIRYEGTAIAQETRTLRFASGELGPLAFAGSTQRVTGRLTVDGALAILAKESGRDITGMNATLTVTVERVAGSTRETVFSGTVQIDGAAGGDVDVSADGDFPISTLILTSLPGQAGDFGIFHVLVIPRVGITYPFNAVVGEDFDLVATVRVDAANIGSDTDVSCVIGTPTTSIQDVISLTSSQSTASSVLSSLAREREDPSGDLAFPSQPTTLCGLFGLEFAAGLLGLTAWRAASARRLRK